MKDPININETACLFDEEDSYDYYDEVDIDNDIE